ncbi:MAG TPA: DUF4340 domain-containing protein, partial [Polyangiaceae bacterium]|nr:DUF4340 domain-containing protein [Polyangiaceae bacterium]
MKASSAATPIALVILAATAVSYAYWVDQGTISDADRGERRRDVFPTFRVDEVHRVEVTGSDSLVLERDVDAGCWMMTSPRRERADPAAVDVLLREMELATRLRDVRAEETAGLAQPRVHGRVSVGPIDYTFAMGADAPTPHEAAYMRVEGEGAFVVGSTLKVQLLRSANAYRDRTLVPYGPSEVSRVEVRAGDEAYALQRVGSTFRLGGADGLRASRQGVERLLSALADTRAEAFLADATKIALPSDALKVTIAPRDPAKPRVVFEVGGVCPTAPDNAILVRTEPVPEAACVARGLLEALRTTSASLVDRAPFFARADEIEEIRLEPIGAPGLRVDVARVGTGWRERAPDARDLAGDEADALGALAGAIADATALEATRSSSEWSSPARRITHRVTIQRTGGS